MIPAEEVQAKRVKRKKPKVPNLNLMQQNYREELLDRGAFIEQTDDSSDTNQNIYELS